MNQDKYLVKEERNEKGHLIYQEYSNGAERFYEDEEKSVRKKRPDGKWIIVKNDDYGRPIHMENMYGLCETWIYPYDPGPYDPGPTRMLQGVIIDKLPMGFSQVLHKDFYDLIPRENPNGDIEISYDQTVDSKSFAIKTTTSLIIKRSMVNETEKT